MKKAVAIIPARGGSKGIPGKNIKSFLGTPLVAHMIRAALEATTISDVIVSSDDEAILTVAKEYGASPLKRPDDISGDEASSEAAVLHAIDKAPQCQTTETIVFLQCTSPLTTPQQIDKVVTTAQNMDADTAFSVVEVHSFLWRIKPDGTGIGVNHDISKPRQRRQDRPAEFRETGAIYAVKKRPFFEAGQRFFGKSVPVVLEDAVEIDLDTVRDWEVLEAYAQAGSN